jgi:hypothetical protein
VEAWRPGLLQGSSSEDVDAPPTLIIHVLLYIFIWMNNVASWRKMIDEHYSLLYGMNNIFCYIIIYVLLYIYV